MCSACGSRAASRSKNKRLSSKLTPGSHANFRCVLAVHLQGAIQIIPLILGLIRGGGTHSKQGPTSPHYGNQSIAMLIGHPHARWPSTSHVQALEPFAERLLEGGAGRRVFLGVSLGRHPQDPDQSSQPVINPLHTQLGLMVLPQPLLNLFGSFPLPALQTGQQFLQHRPVHLHGLAPP
jgi:hypothetical protein